MLSRIRTAGRASLAAMSLFLIAAAAAPALAQSAASRIDQPTPGTLPSGVSTVPGGGASAGTRSSGQVPPTGAIQSSTDVMESGESIQGRDGNNRIDPIQHLPKDMR